jgi:mannose-6-phosphate isomerase-like protein (cupin superfamily)
MTPSADAVAPAPHADRRPMFATKPLPAARDAAAADGSDVRVLLDLRGGGMAHFTLAAGVTSTAVTHRTVEEIWFVVSGRGEMWRRHGPKEEIVALAPGTCVTIPLGTHFQFRAVGQAPLTAVAVTMPPWPGDDEAVAVTGPWTPTTRGAAVPPPPA